MIGQSDLHPTHLSGVTVTVCTSSIVQLLKLLSSEQNTFNSVIL